MSKGYPELSDYRLSRASQSRSKLALSSIGAIIVLLIWMGSLACSATLLESKRATATQTITATIVLPSTTTPLEPTATPTDTTTPTITITPTATLTATISETPPPTLVPTNNQTQTITVIASLVPTATHVPIYTATSPSLSLKITSMTNPVSRGSMSTIKAKTAPSADCTITIYYNSVKVTASGLENKTADSNGDVSWTWKVSSSASTGVYYLVVTAGLKGQIAIDETSFTVQ